MAQTDTPFLDGVAKAFTDAAGMAQSVRTEIDTFMRQRLERLVADMDFVPREEFEAVKAMAAKARAENEALAAGIAALEAKRGWLVPSSSANPQVNQFAAARRGGCFQSCGIFFGTGDQGLATLVPIQNLVPVWIATA